MRLTAPACRLFLLWGLLLSGGQAAEKKKVPEDSPPVLISKDGGNAPWTDAPLVMVTGDGAKPKWNNVEQLKKFAAKGDPQACFELAERTLYGDEVPKDIKQAMPLLEQAGQGGIHNAWFRLGKIYHDGLLGAPDYERTLEYYIRAARAGVPEAQHNIGAMLVSARGVKRDYVEGLAWLLLAERSGAASMAPQQVRNRLAKRPADIRAAEERAKELSADLAHAALRTAATAAPVIAPPKPSLPAPVSVKPTVPTTLSVPKMDPIVPIKPAPPELPALAPK